MKKLFVITVFFLSWTSVSNIDQVPQVRFIDTEQLECLVKNAYHEAFSEGPVGMLLVTQVVFNRAELKNKTYCQIIFEKSQFSWTLFKHRYIKPSDWKSIENLIFEYYNGQHQLPSELQNATHFHANYVQPYWTKYATKLGSWKNHIFYKAENYR